MNETELKKILDLHKIWVESGGNAGKNADLRNADLSYANLESADLRFAKLRGADLRFANLMDADLRYADLRNANLRNANLDFSCWPLWCGPLGVKVDKKLAVQLMYHTLNVMQYSGIDIPNSQKELIEFANQMHRTDVKRLEM